MNNAYAEVDLAPGEAWFSDSCSDSPKTKVIDMFFPICHLLVWLGFPITNKSFNDV